MDLRTIKTGNAIKNAFLQLRAHQPLERMTVTELAREAMISKGTFYLHYHDLYELSEAMQKEVIDDVIGMIQHPEYILYDPAQFTRELFDAFRLKQGLTDILFSGDQASFFPTAIEDALRAYLNDNFEQFRGNPRMNILLTFEVQGGYYAFSQHKNDCSYNEIISTITDALNVVRQLHPI